MDIDERKIGCLSFIAVAIGLFLMLMPLWLLIAVIYVVLHFILKF